MSTHNLCFEQKYKKYQSFLSQNFQFLEVKFSLYLNRRVFVMLSLWGLHRLGSFSAIFYKGGNLHDFLLVFLQNKPLLKRVYSWEQIISF